MLPTTGDAEAAEACVRVHGFVQPAGSVTVVPPVVTFAVMSMTTGPELFE